eukprot:6463052-Amphidinium_carterae.1
MRRTKDLSYPKFREDGARLNACGPFLSNDVQNRSDLLLSISELYTFPAQSARALPARTIATLAE